MCKTLQAFGAAFVMVNMAAFMVWLLVNWASGCGEGYYTAAGWVPGECVSMAELWGPVLARIL